MSATATKIMLSGSTNGKGIKIVHTSSANDETIHQAGNTVATMDEVWLFCWNGDTVDRTITLEWGGTTSPDNTIVQTVPTKSGLYCLSPGLCLNNNLTITCFAEVTNLLVVYGYVNRITV